MISCQGNEYSEVAAGLLEKASALENLIKEAEGEGMDVSYQRVTLVTARVFARLIPGDAVRKVEDYPSDFSDFRILGREEVEKRTRGLADFEAQETERILDRAFQEVKQIIEYPSLQIEMPPPSGIGEVSIKNGAFYCGGKPVFFSGIRFYRIREEELDIQRELGVNVVAQGIAIASSSMGWDEFDDSYFRENVLPKYQLTRGKEFFVSPAIYVYDAPAWLTDIDPEIMPVSSGKRWRGEGNWFRWAMDVDHPLAERYIRSACSYATSQVKDLPGNFCYMVGGEEHCKPNYRSKYTAKRYVDWLREKYRDIDKLNKAWQSDYKDFEDVSRESFFDKKYYRTEGDYDLWSAWRGNYEDFQKDTEGKVFKTRGAYYDWFTFNQYRLTAFNQWHIDGIKKANPKALVTCWPAMGGLVSMPVGGHHSHLGVNWEDVINQNSVVGWDGCIFPREAIEAKRYWKEPQWEKYSLEWRDEIIYYDFAKSVAQDKPIYDPEWHTITCVRHMSPLGISSDFVRTTLWMEHLHGMGANLTWWWGRTEDGTPRGGEFLGGLLTQPQLLESWGRTVLELRRLTEYIILFPQLERRVRILYSEPSSIQDGKVYGDELSEVYESLYFLDYPAGFITEKMIREGKLKDCSILVIPNAKYVNEEAASGIREWQREGGRVVVRGKDALRYDEYGRERNISDFLRESLYLSGSMAEEYAAQLDDIMDEVGIERPVRAFDKEGKNAWGVELRTASQSGKRVVYLINLKRNNAEVTLKRGKITLKKVKDLVSNKTVELGSPFVLEPRKPILLELLE